MAVPPIPEQHKKGKMDYGFQSMFDMGAYDFDTMWNLKREYHSSSMAILSSEDDWIENMRYNFSTLKNLWKYPRTICPRHHRDMIDKAFIEIYSDFYKLNYLENYNVDITRMKIIMVMKLEFLGEWIFDLIQIMGLGMKAESRESIGRKIERGLLHK